MKYNFSGYATKFNVKCSDGRTIKESAFKHNDGLMIPLVWSHGHDDPTNVIGHGLLEYREGDGMYVYGAFNSTEKGAAAKLIVEHGDIGSLSIYANQLKQAANDVIHGQIREVSLVLTGANPEALIDYVELAHGDGYILSNTDALIFTAEKDADLKHVGGEIEIKHADNGGDKTIAEVFETFTEDQKTVVYAMLAEMGGEDDESLQQNDGGSKMKKNVFENKGDGAAKGSVLKHSDIRTILENAKKTNSLRQATLDFIDGNDELKHSFLEHAGTYGIDNIDFLFPDARNVMDTPEFDKRRSEWVSDVLSSIRKVPFSRIKSMYADITAIEARAKGYIKGNEKIEEVFPVMKRTTEPTTIYKKQKLDRDDIIDITDFDVVMWLKAEMRLMLDEELAQAYLIGDGRAADSQDKIDETKIRPIYKDADIYAHKLQLLSTVTGLDELEAMVRARKQYKGSGKPALYTTIDKVTDWMLLKDGNQNYRFRSTSEIATFIGVSKIVEVEVMEGVSREVGLKTYDLIGIMVNLRDYTSGADKGGALGMFNQFDIDFNQEKYLMETRCSGALTKIRSAVVVEKEQPAG